MLGAGFKTGLGPYGMPQEGDGSNMLAKLELRSCLLLVALDSDQGASTCHTLLSGTFI